jgi:glyoxylase-like metal-dependent hydrolase (beta-lactamase superfamily II)
LSREPRVVLDAIWSFPPNRDTFGGTAYFIVGTSVGVPSDSFPDRSPKSFPDSASNSSPSAAQNVLIDCPSWDEATQAFLQQQGGVGHLVITHRQGASPAAALIQQQFGCQVWVQEQEAYLLPDCTITPFQQSAKVGPVELLWTPGFSPGSTCVYMPHHGGVLFTGRHLLPDQQGRPTPLRTAKTFHWPRQLRSVTKLLERFERQSLHYLCPGANTGFLRQQRFIDHAYDQLVQLNLEQLSHRLVGL